MCSHCVGSHPTENCFNQKRKGKDNEKSSSPFNSHKPKSKCTKRNNQKPNVCFRCGLEDHWITDLSKPKIWRTEFTGTQK